MNLIYEYTCKVTLAAQKMKFSIMDFFSNCDQVPNFQRIWSHLLKKTLMKSFTFCVVIKTLDWSPGGTVLFHREMMRSGSYNTEFTRKDPRGLFIER